MPMEILPEKSSLGTPITTSRKDSHSHFTSDLVWGPIEKGKNATVEAGDTLVLKR